MKAKELEARLGAKKRKTVSDLKKVLSTQSDNNPNFCLFLGAGASCSSGIRSAGDMVADWRRNVFNDLCPDAFDQCNSVETMIKWLSEKCIAWYDEKREYATLIEKQFPLQTNRRKFIETEVSDKIPSIGYAYLVRIAEANLVKTIFTTNFDDLLNEAFYQFSSERALVCAHDSSVRSISITSSRAKIIKLHGDYLFDDIKNTVPETANLEENMKDKLSEFLKEYGLVISGYSGSDKSINRILEDLLDKRDYLQNGLFWCFRENDDVRQETLELLEKGKSFFIITTGFDELMADLYTILDVKSSPFSSKLASDRASDVINSYLQNTALRTTKSPIIRKHLESLESDKNASLMSDMIKDLNAERLASSGLSDHDMLVYLEIERFMKGRDPEAALEKLAEELSKTSSKRFKEILLQRRFACSTRLNKLEDARKSLREIMDLDPRNYYVALSESSLLEDRKERLAYLANLKNAHPKCSVVLNRFADELRVAIETNDKLPDGCKASDGEDALRLSLEIDPSLENPAWSDLFSIMSRRTASAAGKNQLRELVSKHLARDPYCCETTSILYKYCRQAKTVEFDGRPLFEYLNEAYERHFPRNLPGHLSIFVRACIEFSGHRYLRPILEQARANEDLTDDPLFAKTMMDVHLDVFRDIDGAISHGREYLKKRKKTSIELKLLDLHLENGDTNEAWKLHGDLKGAIDLTKWLVLEAKIMEFENRFQDAIDNIERVPDRREFDEKYTSHLSYLELRMEHFGKAVKRCRDFLQSRSFPLYYEAEIINYEYGKMMDGRKIDPKRVSRILGATDSESVRAVCHSLLNENDKALDVLRFECEKRFSKCLEYLRWPVLSKHHSDLSKLKEDLLKGKRGLKDLPDPN